MSGKLFHAPFLSHHPDFLLKAVVERNQKKAKQDYPDIKSYDTIQQLLADESLDLIVINTPNYLHFEHTALALKSKKHVLVEKPFTATSAQANILFELADTEKRQIFFYQNRRWDSDFCSVKQVLAEGKLGKLIELHIRFERYRNEIGPKTFKEQALPASGLLYDLGPHLLDQAISLLGKPSNFYKVLGKNRQDTVVDDFFFIHLSYPNHVNVFIYSSMLVIQPQPAYVLHGTCGSFIKARSDVQENQLLNGIKPIDPDFGIEKPQHHGFLTTIDAHGNRQETTIKAEKGNYMQLFEAVFQSIVYQKPYPITPAQILLQLEILESKP